MQARTLLRTERNGDALREPGRTGVPAAAGRTAIVMNYLQSETGANVQLDDDAFWNVDHVTLAYYPVGVEDYEGTSVRIFLSSLTP